MNKLSVSHNNLQMKEKAAQSLIESSYIINKDYLSELAKYEVQPLINHDLNTQTDVRLFKIERIVLENKQSALESLTAAYTALGVAGFTVFFYISSDSRETSLYIGVRGNPKRTQGSNAGRLLEETFKGHFPGSQLTKISSVETNDLLIGMGGTTSKSTSVTAVSGVPSLSTDDKDNFIQGLEKFIDASEGRVYQGLILAEPVAKSNLDMIRLGYEQVATQLSPLMKQTMAYGENQSNSVSDSIGYSLSESLGKSLSLTESKGETNTTGGSNTIGSSESSSSTANRVGIASAIPVIGNSLSAFFKLPNSNSESISQSSSQSSTESFSNTFSSTATSGVTNTTNTTNTINANKTDSISTGNNKTLSIESLDKGIERLLGKIDHQLDRVEEANRYGGWNTAAYFFGEDFASSESLASIFLGVMRGQNSNTENFALTTWEHSNVEQAGILRWLKNISHPRLKSSFLSSLNKSYLTPATLVSGQEMAVLLSLPRKSTSGTAVIDTQSFGRKIQYLDGKIEGTEVGLINLGKIRHLWEDRDQKVSLDLNQLTSHMFVTGSTGSGKSNTLYGILSQLYKQNIPFLVIEPAKGEYKHVFGNLDNVSVYGTNPNISELLKINPFAFPSGVHILEHVDRLVEIFNVCWPMYAAMPAVLKEAILESYEKCGWDLDDSTTSIEVLFPSFIDVFYSLEDVIQKSSFSEEVKSNYVGSLVTRIKSLTNGLNGQIFVSDEIASHQLFDSNCIVDLSRVGSSETKSLIMGILLVRLNEYRMSDGKMNHPLRHVTVIEEAHNILKASASAGQEGGASLESKSIEMITNAIAEMRTFGEGFIIVDQSPGAVDISAIRNTNTKIIMRLPEEMDRRAIGKSIGLEDEQLDELSKFPTGIALVKQNNWLEPVLCHINKSELIQDQQYQYVAVSNNKRDLNVLNLHLARFLLRKHMMTEELVDLSIIKKGLNFLKIKSDTKKIILDLINTYEINGEKDLWGNTMTVNPNMIITVVDAFGVSSKIEKIIRYHLNVAVNENEPLIQMRNEIHQTFNTLFNHLASNELISALSECHIIDYSNNFRVENLYQAWLEGADLCLKN